MNEADLNGADLRGAKFPGAELTDARFDHCALDHNADLLTANWTTLRIGDTTYRRNAVERGEQVLPFGMGPRLDLLIETARLEGRQAAAAAAVVDYVAKAAPGVSAKVIHEGGGGTIIRFSVRGHEDANVLLQVGDGFCRLIGLGGGVTAALPGATATDLDERFALQAQRVGYQFDDLREGLDGIREALTKVTLSGFNDKQMAALRTVAELGSEFLEVKVHEDYVEALRAPSTLAGKLAKATYETKVAKPLRVLQEALFDQAYKAQLTEGREPRHERAGDPALTVPLARWAWVSSSSAGSGHSESGGGPHRIVVWTGGYEFAGPS